MFEEIGKALLSLFAGLGTEGQLLFIFSLFYIDAMVIPTVPELFTVLIYGAQPSIPFALMILGTIVIAEILGTSTLYYIIKKVKVPKRIQKAADKYCAFLLVKDEKIILLNRVAPILPFMGAFAALCNWNYRKVMLYTVVGGVAKYGAILAMANVFYAYMTSSMASMVTIIMVFGLIAISFIYSYITRKKEEKLHEGR